MTSHFHFCVNFLKIHFFLQLCENKVFDPATEKWNIDKEAIEIFLLQQTLDIGFCSQVIIAQEAKSLQIEKRSAKTNEIVSHFIYSIICRIQMYIYNLYVSRKCFDKIANIYILWLSTFFFFFKKFTFFYLFIYDCVESSFLCEGFLQLRRVGTTLHRGARASLRRGLSCCGAQAPDAQAQ